MDIVNTQWCLLGFSYTDHLGNTRFFVFRVLPFGLSSAGFVFTKLLRVLIHYWRTKGIRIVAFFDDGIGAVLDYHKGLAESKIVKSTLLNAGFIPNVSKSSWIPVQTLAWLGFCYDLIKRLIYAQTQKLDKIKTLIVSHRKSKFIHERTLSSIVGSIVALHLSHRDIVYLRTKRMQMQIAKDTRWDIYIRPNDFTRDEMNFWLNYMYDNNGLSVDSPTAAAAVTYSDASATGCASIITPCPKQESLVTHRDFTEHEQTLSSTYRELVAVFHGLETAKHQLAGHALKWHTDSKNIVSIVRKGSMIQPLLELALSIFHITRQFNITLSMNWISRDYNENADRFSRIIDHDDWGVSPSAFSHICDIMGPITIDRFADTRNTKAVRFNSHFFCPNCEAVDTFTQDWHADRNWIVPPLYLVQRAIDYLMLCQAKSIVICPLWKSAHYWPKIISLFTDYPSHVLQHLELDNIYINYQNQNSIFGKPGWPGTAIVLSLDFS